MRTRRFCSRWTQDCIFEGGICNSGIGIVVSTANRYPEKGTGHGTHVAIFWCDGGGVIDWEPKSWLNILSAGKS